MESIGTYPLPESQLDRFAVKLKIGYPSADHEMKLFQEVTKDPLSNMPNSVIHIEQLLFLMDQINKVHISSSVAQYIKRVVDLSRTTDSIRVGISTRGALMWVRLSAALAVVNGRDYVIPDDLQFLAVQTLAHRIIPSTGGDQAEAIRHLITTTAVI